MATSNRDVPATNSDPNDDSSLAARLALQTGELLLGLRRQAKQENWSPWKLEEAGDFEANRLICDELARCRPDDAVLSEELRDDGRRFDAARVWIVDPLDGSYDFGDLHATSYAVHIALVAERKPVAAAVSIPELAQVFCTGDADLAATAAANETGDQRSPIIISGRSTAGVTMRLAQAMGGQALVAGSAGVKAMAVVEGRADIYFHPSGLYEWDACAPSAIAESSGLSVSDLQGLPITYNKAAPEVHGLLIARPDLASQVLDLIN